MPILRSFRVVRPFSTPSCISPPMPSKSITWNGSFPSTSGGVICSLPGQKGQAWALLMAAVYLRNGLGRWLRTPATMTHRPITGSLRSSESVMMPFTMDLSCRAQPRNA